MKALFLIPVLALSACEAMMVPASAPATGPAAASAPVAPSATLDPTPPPPPPAAAVTVDDFDTTTAEDKAEALAVTAPAAAALGTTLVSLGSPADPGIWLKTPLVSELTPGRVAYGGNEANVELRPSGGVVGSGSEMSLPAMRVLEIPLTEIAEVTVSRR
ncbi:D-galactarate dehydratase [Loktanella sp. 3ANDIMAR09]|uniref:D-galactarate dehydratase n=1 Tax=Loktanella sp. 3ANDIMAR09 TaxID=1225657 RepID=UPI000708001C|nr:D-galactarate dehydratase [Loktanella sp. 3ANDIMAR09]KQI68537.1 D-galactarate dehydratase [Loktanella sp. 3ANDIMAR09]